VCSFPEGEDPDSFSKNNTLHEVQEYLSENAKDFIQYKASLLVAEAKGDPVKKAGLIRDMVESISKIPDTIKREIYVQECARIMDIKEDVLFDTLAQIRNKETGKQDQKLVKKGSKSMEVVLKEPEEKIDRQYVLERKIVELLLLYGAHKETFEDLIIQENEKGELEEKQVSLELYVYEKIYLELQQDEIEFANAKFKTLYEKIMDGLTQDRETFKVDKFINLVATEEAITVSDIILNEEKYLLHRWDTKEIYVKKIQLPKSLWKRF
jgi:DNA primase